MLHAIKQAVLFATRPLVCTSLLVAVVASGPTRGSEQGRTGRLVGTYETAKTLTLNRAYVLVVNDAGEIEDSTSAKPGKPFVFESIREGGNPSSSFLRTETRFPQLSRHLYCRPGKPK